MKKNPKGSKNFEKKKKRFDDAQNHMKKTKTKRKSPSPILRGHDRQF